MCLGTFSRLARSLATIYIFARVLHFWHVSAFLCNREFLGISCYIKKRRSFLTFPETAPQLFDHFCP